jgi:DNA-binding Xre family transcriptional regulator
MKEPIMKKSKNNKPKSTFERLMQDPKWKAGFEKGYEKFLISELLIEAMEDNKISVRKLAQKARVSPTIIQNMRSGKSSNISLNTLAPILSALHYKIKFVKETTR